MSTPATNTNGAAEVCIPINDTGTYLGASLDGTSQASNTISHAQEHREKLEAEVAKYSKIIAQPPTDNSPVVGSGLVPSDVPDRASDLKDRGVSHHNPFPSHLADEHSSCKLAELQTQTQSYSGLGETHAASTVVSAPTVTTSSDNTDNADTQPTSSNEDVAFEDLKSEGSATDRACCGADSDRSNPSESSDRSSSGSPDPTTSTPNDKLAGLAGWDGSVPEKEEESGIASQLPRLRYPKDVMIEVTPASQSSTPETANHAQERKNAASQDQAFQPGVQPKVMRGVTSAFQSSIPSTANVPRERQNASVYEEPHELQSVRTLSKASPHAESAFAASYAVDLEAANPAASSHNGLRPAFSPQVTVDVQHEPERESHLVKLFKRITTVVGLVAALALGFVAYGYKHDLLLACTIVIMIASVDAMIQSF